MECPVCLKKCLSAEIQGGPEHEKKYPHLVGTTYIHKQKLAAGLRIVLKRCFVPLAR
jgi:hypothetical protein